MRRSSPSSRPPLHLVLWSGLLAVCGCASASIQAVRRDPAFHDRITRLLVIIADDKSNDAELMQSSIHGRLEAKRIAHRIVVVSGSSEAPSLDGPAGASVPQAILRINPIATIRSPNGARGEIRYDASLFPPAEDLRRIWRAQLVHYAGALFDTGESGLPHRTDLLAQQLVDQLIADGIIGPG